MGLLDVFRGGRVFHPGTDGVPDGGVGVPSVAGETFPPLTHRALETLLAAEAHFPPRPVGPHLYAGCPHVPREHAQFHLPFLMSQNILWGLGAHLRPARYLEIGTHHGSSLLAVFRGAGDALATVTSVDHNPLTQTRAEENLRAAGFTGEGRFLVGDSHSAPVEGLFDFVYVDGDHSFRGARNDIRRYWGHVAPGGWLSVDNTVDNLLPDCTAEGYTWEGARRATNFPVLPALLELVSHDRLPGLDTVVYQYPSWSGFALLGKAGGAS